MLIYIFLISFFLSFQSYSEQIIYKCEDGFSYKIISKEDNKSEVFFIKDNFRWKELLQFNLSESKLEFRIPGLSYLSCSNKELPICKYDKVITRNYKKNIFFVEEIVSNDCYVGMMGCNKYNKGLAINRKRCIEVRQNKN